LQDNTIIGQGRQEEKEKMSKKVPGRVRVLYPGIAAAFAGRLRAMVGDSGITQVALGDHLGGYDKQVLTRVFTGRALTIPMDLAVQLAAWAEQRGYCLRWLFTGVGAMRAAPAQPGQANYYATVGEVLRGMGIHLTGAPAQEPRGPIVVSTGAELLTAMRERASARRAAPPAREIRTVPPEAVPTSTDWHRRFVPIVGRLAAGDAALDAVEARQYPPGWCGEFLVYQGAPPTGVAVRVQGQSMQPIYRDGDIVVVDPAQHVRSGLACVMIDVGGEREPVLKRLTIQGGNAILASDNTAYAPRIVPVEQLVGAYKIIEHLPRGGKGGRP